jgi:SNF2 family DNA or RNA helicase
MLHAASRRVKFSDVLQEVGATEEVQQKFAHIHLPFRPMAHQIKGLDSSLFHTRSGLFFEPRTGKTLCLQMLAIYYAHFGVGTMQIMPPALFSQFMHDYSLIEGHGLRIEVLNGLPAKRAEKLAHWKDYPGTRPHIVLLSREIFKGAWKDLYLMGFTNVHFDESHMGLQNEDSQIAKNIRQFMYQSTDNRLVLSTGTPIPNKIENAYATVNLLVPEVYKSRASFNSTHCIYKTIYVPDPARDMFRKISVIDEYYNLDYLSTMMYWKAIHASKREVLKLDAPNIQIVECELNTKHRRLYNKVINERILEIGDEIIDARTAQKLRQVALQLISVPEEFSLDVKVADNSVYDTVKALVESINPDNERITIFANFTRSVEALARLFRHLNPAIVYGPYGPEKNAKEVQRFHDDPKCRVLIANPAAGGVGFKLGDVCQTVIFAEPVSSPGVFDQALSRVMLMGQTEPVVCYIVKVNRTLSPIAIDQMLNKFRDINEVMKSKKTILDALMGKQNYPEQDEEVEEYLEAA